jgi:hypothetical protein
VKQPKEFTIGEFLIALLARPRPVGHASRRSKWGVSVTIEARYLPGRIATVAKRIFVMVFYLQYWTASKQH